jgi:hypothetical protein
VGRQLQTWRLRERLGFYPTNLTHTEAVFEQHVAHKNGGWVLELKESSACNALSFSVLFHFASERRNVVLKPDTSSAVS